MTGKVAYLMRKTEDGYEPLGDYPAGAWVEESVTVTDASGKVAVLSSPDGRDVTFSWVTVREAALLEIREQPFF